MTNVDDALSYTVATLKGGQLAGRGGYDVYTQDLIDKYLIEREHLSRDQGGYKFRDRGIQLSPLFSCALWELCRRGVLRPGLREFSESGVGHNTFGCGFSVTPQGTTWLQHAEYDHLASVIPGRFVELLSAHERRFGSAFLARGAEAIRCYSAHAFLACCAMCGAAAESILLALAREREAPEVVWKKYFSVGGRGRLENLLIGQAPDHVKREFQGFMVLITYWRNEAAHGGDTTIREVEAFTSLMLLLRLARYADETFF
jgi:hypothetical protein